MIWPNNVAVAGSIIASDRRHELVAERATAASILKIMTAPCWPIARNGAGSKIGGSGASRQPMFRQVTTQITQTASTPATTEQPREADWTLPSSSPSIRSRRANLTTKWRAGCKSAGSGESFCR